MTRRGWGIVCFSCGVLPFAAGVVFANASDTTAAMGGLLSGPALSLAGAVLLKNS